MDFGFLGKELSLMEVAKLRKELVQKLDAHLCCDRVESMPIACRIRPMKDPGRLEASWFSHEKAVVVFLENDGVMVSTTVDALLLFLEKREPWQDFDMCIFDQGMTWCVALTHNDEVKLARFAVK